MGLFNELGRQVEQFTQTVRTTADESAEFRCRACDARFHTERERCPDCGGAVVPITERE